MNEVFREHVEQLHGKFEKLVQMKPVGLEKMPKSMEVSGIYLFSEGSKYLYIGRSRNIRRRLRLHVAGGLAAASFAFKLARETFGQKKASYVAKGSKKDLGRECQEFRV